MRAVLSGAVVCAIALAVTGPALADPSSDVTDGAIGPGDPCQDAGLVAALFEDDTCTVTSTGDELPVFSSPTPDPLLVVAPDSILDPKSTGLPDLPGLDDDEDSDDESDSASEDSGDKSDSGNESDGSEDESDSDETSTETSDDAAPEAAGAAGDSDGPDSDVPATSGEAAEPVRKAPKGDSGAGAAVGRAVLPGVGDAVDGGTSPGLDWTGALAADTPPVPGLRPFPEESAVLSDLPAPASSEADAPVSLLSAGEPIGDSAAVAFAAALPSAAEVGWDLGSVLPSLVLTLLLLAVLALPAGAVNRATADHAERVDALLARLRAPPAPGGNAPGALVAAVLVTAAAGAVLLGFLTPAFPFDGSAPAILAGLVAALVVVTVAQQGSQLLYVGRWWGIRCHLALFPGFLLLSAVAVVLSRAVGLEPGLVVGTLVAFGAARPLRDDEQGPASALAATALTAVGGLAWILRDPLVAAAGAPGAFLPDALAVALTATTVAAASNLVFALVPVSFLPGAGLLRWSPTLWAVFVCIGGFAFVHLVARPAAGALADRAGLLAVLLGLYLLGAGALWAWLRYGFGLTAVRLTPVPRR